MVGQEQNTASIFDINLRPAATAFLLMAMFVATVANPPLAQAQTYKVLHTFTGGADGSGPGGGGITSDSTGNLYGVTVSGGVYSPNCLTDGEQNGCGTAYRMTRKAGAWTFNVLYSFDAEGDGYAPDEILAIASDGSLYGSTFYGPNNVCSGNGCGTVFRLQPPAAFCSAVSCPWSETVLHRFQGYPNDGSQPAFGHLTFDTAGNLYGTTSWGGPGSVAGSVYELTRNGNSWTEYVLHNFTGGYDGDASWSGVVFDPAGNLYGTTTYGGANSEGVIFQMVRSGSGWSENVLHSFNLSTDGGGALGSVVLDAAGNLYGTTRGFGPHNGGTVWELSPANGSWNFSVIYAFSGSPDNGPDSGLLMDRVGNLYGATSYEGAHGWGNVFKLSPGNGGWTYTSLYDFSGGSDGGAPDGQLTMDSQGNLFGATFLGGSGQGYQGNGVVFEITP